MLIETTLEEREVGLIGAAPATSALTVWLRSSWLLGKLLLTGLLLTYLVGWVQDFQRISRLEAEPSPPYKVISKNEAWRRIHPGPVR